MDTIVLFSGGLDSTVILAEAVSEGKKVLALSFNYGQRHKVELKHARQIADHYKAAHRIVTIDPQTFGLSCLVYSQDVPVDRTPEEIQRSGNNATYVPARNTLFLAYALGQAEVAGASEILYGPNASDRYCFPDCDIDFIHAFQGLIDQAMKQTMKDKAPKLRAPLVNCDKKAIVEKARKLKVPIEMTFSCYNPTPEEAPCEVCDACVLRLNAVESKAHAALS